MGDIKITRTVLNQLREMYRWYQREKNIRRPQRRGPKFVGGGSSSATTGTVKVIPSYPSNDDIDYIVIELSTTSAETFSESATYAADDEVTYGTPALKYVANTAVVEEAWDSTDWDLADDDEQVVIDRVHGIAASGLDMREFVPWPILDAKVGMISVDDVWYIDMMFLPTGASADKSISYNETDKTVNAVWA